jgi:hypothetical protein
MSWRITVTSESWNLATNTWTKRETKYGPYLTQDGASAEVRAAVEHHRETAPVRPARVVAVVTEPTAAYVAEVVTINFYAYAGEAI